MAFRHAFRVSELVDIRWQQIDLDTATVQIRLAKNGTLSIHGLQGDELRLLRALRREHPHADFVFLSERKAPISVDGMYGKVTGAPISHDPDQCRRSAGTNNTSMAFDPRRLSILEVAGVTTIILSAVALASVVYAHG